MKRRQAITLVTAALGALPGNLPARLARAQSPSPTLEKINRNLVWPAR